MGKSKIECKKLDALTGDQKCVFCNRTDLDEIKYGPIYMHKNIITHYYCLLLSSNMEQNGRDCDGILGFLANDITKEVSRGKRLYCSFCRGGGATLGCAIAKCKVVFHLPCGMKHGTLHQFYGEFKSFCAKHRPVQRISEKILAEASKNAMCGICYEKVVPRPIHETLWAPCCQKSAFFHRDCVQKLATSAGYFFKCPLCNNSNIFQKEMKEFGIYIPEQDASWECVPNAYQDLLVRHDTCDSITCSCPSGRKTNNQGTRWELILCKFCGSQGIHIGCGRLKWRSPEFVCDTCSGTNSQSEEVITRTDEGNRHRLTGAGRAAEIHPSVSADREADLSDNSSDDSTKVTLCNRRRRIISPSPVTDKPHSKRSHDKHSLSSTSAPTCTMIIEDDDSNDKQQMVEESIIIDDSDDDVEVVSETNGNCLMTKDGSTIPVVQMKEVQSKAVNIEGDVKVISDKIVITDEVIDITQSNKSSQPRLPVQEIIYNITPPTPSTSAATAYSAPSTSYAPPPEVTKYYLVDPSSNTVRAEDIPAGAVVYRSVHPVASMPSAQPPVPASTIPVQYFSCDNSSWNSGGGVVGVVQMPNIQISVNTGPGTAAISSSCATQQKHIGVCCSRSVKCDSGRRRRGRRHHHDRLNPQVRLSPLKGRVSNDGHFEIVLKRRKLTFGSTKRKASPLPSRPLKKLKRSTSSHSQKTSSPKVDFKKNKKIKSKLKIREKVASTQNKSVSIEKMKNSLSSKLNKKDLENIDKTNKNCKTGVKSKVKNPVAVFVSPTEQKKKKQKYKFKNESKIQLENNSPESSISMFFSPTHQKKESPKYKLTNGNKNQIKSYSPEDKKNAKSKKKSPLTEWKYKRIDYYLNKLESKSQTKLKEPEERSPSTSEKCNDKYVTIQKIMEDIIDFVVKDDPLREQNDIDFSINGANNELELSMIVKQSVQSETNTLCSSVDEVEINEVDESVPPYILDTVSSVGVIEAPADKVSSCVGVIETDENVPPADTVSSCVGVIETDENIPPYILDTVSSSIGVVETNKNVPPADTVSSSVGVIETDENVPPKFSHNDASVKTVSEDFLSKPLENITHASILHDCLLGLSKAHSLKIKNKVLTGPFGSFPRIKVKNSFKMRACIKPVKRLQLESNLKVSEELKRKKVKKESTCKNEKYRMHSGKMFAIEKYFSPKMKESLSNSSLVPGDKRPLMELQPG